MKLCFRVLRVTNAFGARRQKNHLLLPPASRHHRDFQKHLRPRTLCLNIYCCACLMMDDDDDDDDNDDDDGGDDDDDNDDRCHQHCET